MLGECLFPDDKCVLPHHGDKIIMKNVMSLELGVLVVFLFVNKSSNRLSDSFYLLNIRVFSHSLLEDYYLY